MPQEARWAHLKAQARQPTIGQTVDRAMTAIERDNPALKEVLPKDYARPALDKQRLGQLIDMMGNIRVGDAEARSRDVLGRVYEYFLSQFASAEGKRGGEFYTPRCVVRLLVEMLEPYRGRVYDPCCGSSGMFVQSIEFIRANPPFNVSDWGGDRLVEDKRWRYGIPPKGNANFAWVQHMVHHLAPKGVAGFVLANGSMSSSQSGEGEIRKNLIEGELVDCMVALPGQLFYSTQIPACLWFLARGRKRRGEILFVDARKLGRMVDRTHRELTEEDIAEIAATYHAWRGGEGVVEYEDRPGFCKSATLEEAGRHGHVLTPGRYVGMKPQEDDGEPFKEKMARLTAEWCRQRAEVRRLDAAFEENLGSLGFGVE